MKLTVPDAPWVDVVGIRDYIESDRDVLVDIYDRTYGDSGVYRLGLDDVVIVP